MPYEIVSKHPGCPPSTPVAVVKQGTTRKMGCHTSEAQAKKQMRALYASEGMTNKEKGAFSEIGYLEIGQMRDGRTREINERFLTMAANIVSNANVSDPVGALHKLVDEYLRRMDDWQAG